MMTHASTKWHPIAHVAVQDATCRSAIVETLHGHGWSVVEQPTGLHLIHAISGIILGDQPWLRPGLIVADVVGRGCSGASIALGLRALGLRIPIILITSSKAGSPTTTTVGPAVLDDGGITFVDPARAADAVAQLARSPAGLSSDSNLDGGDRVMRVM